MRINVRRLGISDRILKSGFPSLKRMTGRVTAPLLVATGLAGVLVTGNALAGFVNSTVGTGSAVDPTAAPGIDSVFIPGDTSAPTFADTMNSLYSCLSTNQSCAANQRTAALDLDNDGSLTASEILSAFTRMSCLSGVPSDDKYARAVITEVRQLSDLSDCAAVQNAITTANGCAVDSPVITDP